MTQKVFISANDSATFVCPQCGNASTANVSKYTSVDKKVTVSCRCNCGHHFKVILEKRRQYRKQTDLPGMYSHRLGNGSVHKGTMRVLDISTKGLKLKLNAAPDLKVGTPLRVEFHLDDKRRTFIDKEVIVRNVNKNLVGTAFAPTEGDDASLGFYLMS